MDNGCCRGSEGANTEQTVVCHQSQDVHDNPKPFLYNVSTSVDSCIYSLSSDEGGDFTDEHMQTTDWTSFYYQMAMARISEITSTDHLGSFCTPFNLKHITECCCSNCHRLLFTTTDPHHLPISPLSFDKQQSKFYLHELLQSVNVNSTTGIDNTNESSNDSYSTVRGRAGGSYSSDSTLAAAVNTCEVEYDSSTAYLIMPLRPPPFRRQSSSASDRELMQSVNKSIPPFRLTKPKDSVSLYRECHEVASPTTPQSVLSIFSFTCESLAFTFGAQCSETDTSPCVVACDGMIPSYDKDLLSDVVGKDDPCQLSYNPMSSIFTLPYTTPATMVRSINDIMNRGNPTPIHEGVAESPCCDTRVHEQCTSHCTCCKQESPEGGDSKSKLLLDSSVDSRPRTDDVTYLSILYRQYELDMQIALYPCASIHPCSSYVSRTSFHACTSMGMSPSERVIGKMMLMRQRSNNAQESMVGGGFRSPAIGQCLAQPDMNYSITPIFKFVGID